MNNEKKPASQQREYVYIYVSIIWKTKVFLALVSAVDSESSSRRRDLTRLVVEEGRLTSMWLNEIGLIGSFGIRLVLFDGELNAVELDVPAGEASAKDTSKSPKMAAALERMQLFSWLDIRIESSTTV